MSQVNDFSQAALASSVYFLSYQRASLDVIKTSSEVNSTSAASSISLNVALNVDGLGSLSGGVDVPATVIPGSAVSSSSGIGVAVAGDIELLLDGGSVALDASVDSSLDASTSVATESKVTALWGWITLSESESSLTTSAGANISPYLSLSADLPDIALAGQGAACLISGGDCSALYSDQGLGALSIDHAEGATLVIDRSDLTSAEEQTVALQGAAQESARAVTLANSSGGLLLTGTNIAVSSDDSEASSGELPELALVQNNHLQQYDATATTSSGSIVAYASSADLSSTSQVSIAGSALAGARAVNLINESGTTVAAGLNIWQGSSDSDLAETSSMPAEVMQVNDITQQESGTSASLANYLRASETSEVSVAEGEATSTASTLSTSFNLGLSDMDEDLIAIDLKVPASVIPSSKSSSAGAVVAAAGEAELLVDGGSAALDFGVDISDANVSIEATSDNGSFLQALSADYGTNLTLDVELPDIAVAVDGALCITGKGGTCSATDTELARGAVTAASITAEEIVIDNSSLVASARSSVELTDSAQSEARAIELVNSAGGLLGNGINITNLQGDSFQSQEPLVILQDNIVGQGAGEEADVVSGTVVANDAAATMETTANVRLSGTAQQGSRALVTANQASSQVANGINVWNASLDQSMNSEAVEILQSNTISQDKTTNLAQLDGYQRDESVLSESSTTVTKNTDSAAKNITAATSLAVSDLFELTHDATVPTSIIPTSTVSSVTTTGIGFSGEAALEIDAGSVDLTYTNGLNASSTLEVDGGADMLSILSAEGSLSSTTSYDQNTAVNVSAILPDISILASGAGCYVAGQTCSSTNIEETFGAFSVATIEAENIVVDQSDLVKGSTSSVILSDDAQVDARALVLMSASGADAANGINVANQSGTIAVRGGIAMLQENVLTQSLNQSGGNVIADQSSAILTGLASVVITDAQQNARALIIENMADAAVASGVNVWNSSSSAEDSGVQQVEQVNDISQTLATSTATVSDYQRAANSLNESSVVADSTIATQVITASFDADIDDFLGLSDSDDSLITTNGDYSIPAAVIPTSSGPGSPGTAAGFAGSVELAVGGGSLDATLSSYNSFSTEHSTELAAGASLFGLLEASGEVELDADLAANVDTIVTLTAEFPLLQIAADGSVCYASDSDCSAATTEVSGGAFSVDSVSADNIVMDGSSLSISDIYNLTLSGNAQAGARAAVIVNASGGAVSNSINISNIRGGSLTASGLGLVQSNVVAQVR